MAKTKSIVIDKKEYELTKWSVVKGCRMTQKCLPLVNVLLAARDGSNFEIENVLEAMFGDDEDGLSKFVLECLEGTVVKAEGLSVTINSENIDDSVEDFSDVLLLVKEALVFNLTKLFQKGLESINK